MKGLTAEEFAELSFLASPHEHRPVQALDVLADLIERGCVEYRATPEHPRFRNMYFITGAGREAVRLWPLVRQFMVSVASPPKAAP